LHKKLNELRSKLRRPIQFIAITKKIEAIINNSSLSKKEKKERIEEIRKEAGLSRREMREIFTGRLEKIYNAAKKEVDGYRKVVLNNMQNRLKETERVYGYSSPEAAEMRSEIKEVENVFKPYLTQLESNRSFCKGLYGGKSCIKRTFGAIGGAFKKVGSFLKNVVKWSPIGLLAQVPILRSFLSPILDVVNRAIDLGTRVFDIGRGLVKGVRDFFRNPLATIKKAARFAWDMFKKNWKWITPLALNAIPVIGQVLAPIARTAIRAYTIGKMAYNSGKQLYETTRNLIRRPANWIYEKVNGLWDNWVGSQTIDHSDKM
jgi:hypothetical protein